MSLSVIFLASQTAENRLKSAPTAMGLAKCLCYALTAMIVDTNHLLHLQKDLWGYSDNTPSTTFAPAGAKL